MIFENQAIKYVLTLLAIGGGATRLDWLFGDQVGLALQRFSIDLCWITHDIVCF